MRKSDIAYVPNGPVNYYPAKKLEDMTLQEIVKKYIRTCGKANGSVSVCSKCQSPCQEGKRAIQLLANEVYNDPPVPLYGGKTLIERAKEENMKRRAEQNELVKVTKDNINVLADAIVKAKAEALGQEMKMEEKKEKKSRRYIKMDGWWEMSLESGDQIKWVMENMQLSKTQAKKKIYQYKWTHGLTEASVKQPEKVEEKVVEKPVEVSENKPIDSGIENVLEKLMRQQEDCKKEMEKYQKLLDEARRKYDEVKKKTDILCSAMDILSDT